MIIKRLIKWILKQSWNTSNIGNKDYKIEIKIKIKIKAWKISKVMENFIFKLQNIIPWGIKDKNGKENCLMKNKMKSKASQKYLGKVFRRKIWPNFEAEFWEISK